MTKDRDSISIIGLGKVGTAVGFLLRSSGYEIAAVSDTSEEALTRGMKRTGGTPCADPSHAASLADTVIITTHDDAIKTACDRIAADNAIKPGTKVIHMSGAGGLDLLESARHQGAVTASIHPIQAFADVTSAIENIPGSTFGITAQDDMREWAVQFVKDLDGTPFFVSENDKPLYHAAACIASNYLVTLMNIVVNVYQALGLSPDEAMNAFWPLVRGTVKNMEDHGPVRRAGTPPRCLRACVRARVRARWSRLRQAGACAPLSMLPTLRNSAITSRGDNPRSPSRAAMSEPSANTCRRLKLHSRIY